MTKNVPLTGRNLEQSKTPCRRPSAATVGEGGGWQGEDERHRGEGEVETEKEVGERKDGEMMR